LRQPYVWYSVCQWLEADLWLSPGTLVSSTHKIMTHTIHLYNGYTNVDILLKVALKPIIPYTCICWSTWLRHAKYKPYILVPPIAISKEKYCLICSVISKLIQIINVIIIFNNCKIPDNSVPFIVQQNFYYQDNSVYKIWVLDNF
jgi:hypothetical protein